MLNEAYLALYAQRTSAPTPINSLPKVVPASPGTTLQDKSAYSAQFHRNAIWANHMGNRASFIRPTLNDGLKLVPLQMSDSPHIIYPV